MLLCSTPSPFPSASRGAPLEELPPDLAVAAIISSSTTVNAELKTTHSTISSLPSPNVFQTAFSSSDLPVIDTRVPPPDSGEFFCIRPNSTRLGGIK
jgi:hypothetical protein